MFSNGLLYISNKLMCTIIRQNSINTRKTIFALSSGYGKCGIAVFRISGKKSCVVIKSMTILHRLPPSRQARVVKLYHPKNKEHLDNAMVIWFPEDCVELHVHGGTAVVTAISDALSSLDDFRPAEPGEFTKRAYLNNKLNLTEVEGLADLIQSETEIQRRQSLRQMDGELSRLYMHWRQIIIKCLANVEAYIDFGEDEQIEDTVLQTTDKDLSDLLGEMSGCLNDGRRGERLRHGVHVSIVGRPNVGKSTLLNAVCQRPAAIVSPIAGTTRDIVETTVDIGGYPAIFSDTAGITQTDDVIESEGVRRALNRYDTADIRVIMLDAGSVLGHRGDLDSLVDHHLGHLIRTRCTQNSGTDARSDFSEALHARDDLTRDRESSNDECPTGSFGADISRQGITNNAENVVKSSRDNACERRRHPLDIESVDKQLTNSNDSSPHLGEASGEGLPGESRDCLVVFNKVDLLDADGARRLEVICEEDDRACVMSCVTNAGWQRFLEKLQRTVANQCDASTSTTPSITHSRHRHHILVATRHLRDYLSRHDHDIVMAAERLRLAVREIGRITGEIRHDEVLDVLFNEFCIGK